MSKDLEEYMEHFRDQKEKLEELVLDSDEKLINSREELHENLREKYNVEIDTSGEKITYHPPYKNYNSEDNFNECIKLPITEAILVVETDRTIEDVLGEIEERSRRQKEFDEKVLKSLDEDN